MCFHAYAQPCIRQLTPDPERLDCTANLLDRHMRAQAVSTVLLPKDPVWYLQSEMDHSHMGSDSVYCRVHPGTDVRAHIQLSAHRSLLARSRPDIHPQVCMHQHCCCRYLSASPQRHQRHLCCRAALYDAAQARDQQATKDSAQRGICGVVHRGWCRHWSNVFFRKLPLELRSSMVSHSPLTCEAVNMSR